MSDPVSKPVCKTAERWKAPVGLESSLAFLKANCHKQENAIQAIEDSAYIVRHGRRELRHPKLLALAFQLRAKYIADFATLATHVAEWQRVQAYLAELLAMFTDEIMTGPPELRRRIGQRFTELNDKYSSPEDK